MNRLAGKTALVIGGNTGIGREVCRLFAPEGADVAVGDFGREEHGATSDQRDRGLGRELSPSPSTSATRSRWPPPSTRPSIASAASTSWSTTPASPGYHGALQASRSRSGTRCMAVNLRGVFFGMKHVAAPHAGSGLRPHHQYCLPTGPQALPLECLLLRFQGRRGGADRLRGPRGRSLAGHHRQCRLSRADRHPDVAIGRTTSGSGGRSTPCQ